MSKEKPVAVDLSKKEALKPILPCPPILSSHNLGWNDIQVLHHRQPAWETPEHCHNRHVIIIHHSLQPVKTERVLGESKQIEQCHDGEIVIIPALVRHKAITSQENDSTALILEPSYLAHIAHETVDGDHVELIPHFTKPDPLIHQIALTLNSELVSNSRCSRLYIESATTMLAAHLLKHYCVFKSRLLEYDGLPKYKLNQALQYINAHLERDLKLGEIAEAVGMSQYYFLRLFKQSMGVTPYQYVLYLRVERAKPLLKQTKLTISDVAIECGFANQSHFTKLFRKMLGMTPKAYRDN
jgi:AraC family transcriptional regulator